LVGYQALLHRRLAELADSPDLRLLRQFAVWQQLPLVEATQADLDTLPRLELPRLAISRAAPITQHRRLELLGQLLTDDHKPLRSRVAACLMLLFAQPATLIVRLTIDDITRTDDGGVFIRFGQPPTSVPEPFATLLLQATAQRDNLQTATNPGARWLFPRRRAGQPLHVNTLTQLIRDLGIPAWPAEPPRYANSSCRPQPPSSPKRWAIPPHHHPGRHRGRNPLEPLRRW
jgi:hypothetical protein